MLLTGRHPQSTGHILNFMSARHDELSIGDAASAAGYRTAWVGKWHLHRGAFPDNGGNDFIPEGLKYVLEMYCHYLAMIPALDDMLGAFLLYLDEKDLARDTILVFTSDHGTEGGSHSEESWWPEWKRPWQKSRPHEETRRVPMIVRATDLSEPGKRNDVLVSPVGPFPDALRLA
jgi:arylsulfatase A-like enzyme